MSLSIELEIRDMWIGIYWRHDKLYQLWHLYICIVPCLPVHITWQDKEGIE